MSIEPKSSEPIAPPLGPPAAARRAGDDLDEAVLAVLVACQHRGPLAPSELARLIPTPIAHDAAIATLVTRGLLAPSGGRFEITHAGRGALDGVLEAIESRLTPDAPEFVARYRRETPTLPFDANTVWAEAVCVNIRVDPAALRTLVPAVFDLDLHDGFAWVSLTASRLKNFGVAGIPAALRMNFYQATYRAHVTFNDFRGERRRGCYFVRSETNSAVMSLAANLLPEFRAHQCSTHPILMARQGEHLVLSVDSGADPAGKVVLVLDVSRELCAMPAGSRFRSVRDATQFIVDFHDAFAFDPATREVFVLRIERGDWPVRMVEPVDHYLGFVSAGPFPPGSAALDSVFYFTDVPYRWLPLVTERLRTSS